MHIDHIKRGTGRTHNMFVAAFAYAKIHGSATVVMGRDMEVSIRRFCETTEFDEIYNTCELKLVSSRTNPRLMVKPPGNAESYVVYFVSAGHANIEWYQFRLPGVEQAATFFDHHVIEHRFAEVLDRWTRYDNKLSNLNAAAAQRHFKNEQ